MINQYNKLVQKIVHNFISRLFLEDKIWEVPEPNDYRIIDYNWVLQWPIEIWDRYLSLDDILICEANWFTANSLIDYYDEDLGAYYNNNPVWVINLEKPSWLWINYYNYTLKNLDKVAYEKRQANELKESEEKVKEAKESLLNAINKAKL
jgi:hypothetical protein